MRLVARREFFRPVTPATTRKTGKMSEKLLRELAALSPKPSRRARFRCVLAIARRGELIDTVEGSVEGNITEEPRGEDGFGYDPVFVPAGFDHTFAEMPAELKNHAQPSREGESVALRERLPDEMQPLRRWR